MSQLIHSASVHSCDLLLGVILSGGAGGVCVPFHFAAGCERLKLVPILCKRTDVETGRSAGEMVLLLHWSMIIYTSVVKILKKHGERAALQASCVVSFPYGLNISVARRAE